MVWTSLCDPAAADAPQPEPRGGGRRDVRERPQRREQCGSADKRGYQRSQQLERRQPDPVDRRGRAHVQVAAGGPKQSVQQHRERKRDGQRAYGVGDI